MFAIQHVTIYRYARPVRIGEHRMMFRPRDSHDLRLLQASLLVSPPAARMRWIHDVFGNSIAIAEFECETAELRLQSDIVLEHYPLEASMFEIADYARTYPFSYAPDEIPDLARLIERHHADSEHIVDRWAREFVTAAALSVSEKSDEPKSAAGPIDTRALLESIMHAIKNDFTYAPRDAEGTQPPDETLRKRSGSCRDFALLMIEAVRSLGFAARFVSGYIYDPAIDTGGVCDAKQSDQSDQSHQSHQADQVDHAGLSGATHAWVQVYLPGAGWVEFDPSNAIVGGRNLIRIAVARDIAQAVPVSGTWTGAPADYLGMEVNVRVTAHESLSDLTSRLNLSPSETTQALLSLEAACAPAAATFADITVPPAQNGAMERNPSA